MNTLARWACLAAATLIFSGSLAPQAEAELIPVVNAGFEDVSGQASFNEFTFGTPAGWTLYDPDNVIPNPGVFTGTLLPNGVDFFNATAPEGNLVSILFNSDSEGEGEYGFEQTLGTTLQANTDYVLSVEVGNIASGVATNGQFFNLDEFPGYRVELLAGGLMIAEDVNSLIIPEGEFATSTVSLSVGADHPLLGQELGIRLVNLNVIPAGFTQMTSPDLEVDFDNVILTANANAVPEPSSMLLVGMGVLGFALLRRRRASRDRASRRRASRDRSSSGGCSEVFVG